MNEQLHAIINELKHAQERMHALARRVPDDQWSVQSAPGRWSVNENVEHLNMFSETFIPLIRDGLEQSRALPQPAGRPSPRYRRGFIGAMMQWMVGPSTRKVKTKAIASFVPVEGKTAAQIRERFDRFQRELISLTAAAEGLPIDKVPITSPVDERLKYNLFATLGIIARHQHRHLQQAEQSLAL